MSEIVVPCFGHGDELRTVFDIDSPNIGEFDEVDRLNLEKIVALLYNSD